MGVVDDKPANAVRPSNRSVPKSSRVHHASLFEYAALSRRASESRLNLVNVVPSLKVHPAVAACLIVLLPVLTIWLLHVLQTWIPGSRPYTVLFVLPAVFTAALFGIRGGLATGVLTFALARIFLFEHGDRYAGFSTEDAAVRYCAAAFTTLGAVIVTGQLRSVLETLNDLYDRVAQSERNRLDFNRDVLAAVTGGRLRLCESDELSTQIPEAEGAIIPLDSVASVAMLRGMLAEMYKSGDLPGGRIDDVYTCVTEAASNAVKYGGSGVAHVWPSTSEALILITDHGPGISPTDLARATLERGYSTKRTLGMGFLLMLETADSIALHTSASGTSLLIKVGSHTRTSVEEDILAQYEGV